MRISDWSSDVCSSDLRILRALGLGVEANADGWTVTAPTRRFDLAIEEDLVEEVARIHGYDAIPTTLPGGATRLAAPTETRVPEQDLRRQLARSEEHTSELQSLMRISYAVFCLKKKKIIRTKT